MKFFTVYETPPKVVTPSGGKSLTDQSYRHETDINVIMKRFNAGDTSCIRQGGVFADVSGIGDFMQAYETVRNAQRSFLELPANVRERFGNDPRALVSFLQDSSNDVEAVRLGLKVVRSVEPSLSEQIVDGVTKALAKSSTAASVEPSNT